MSRYKGVWRYCAAVSAIAAALTSTDGARAQTAPAVPASDAQTSANLAEVVVTAEKRAENLQVVPISMAVVQGAELAKFDTFDLRDLTSFVPNLYVMVSPGNDAIFIRGFGSNATNFAFDPAVSEYVDGIYGGNTRQFRDPFFDIDHVEVLRGPQGALFGKNTAAGAINIVTAAPTSYFDAAATVDYNATRSGVDAWAYVSGPVTDTLRARLAVKFTDLDGYITNEATGDKDPREHDVTARLTLLYSPISILDVTTMVEFGSYTTLGSNTVTTSLTTPEPVTLVRDADSPFGSPERDYEASVNASTTANLKLGDMTLTSITGFSGFDAERDENAGADNPTIYAPDFDEKFSQLSEELRLLSPIGKKFEYVVGAYFDFSDYKLDNIERYDLLGGLLNGEISGLFKQRADTYSVFGQGTYHITDALRLIGSLRYTRTDKAASFDQFLNFGAPLAAPTFLTGRLGEDDLDPSATIQYDVTRDIMLYATYGHGSIAGGFVSNSTGVLANTFMFQPERSTNYEGGVKSSFADHRVVLDLSIYDTKFDNLQVSVYDPSLASFVTGNAASATSKGVEASLQWLPVRRFDLTASGAYTDAKYNNFPGATCLATETVAQCNPASPASIEANNIAGTPLPWTSKWTASVQAHYTAPLGDALRLDATANLHYRSAFFTSASLSPIWGTQSGVAKIDLRLQVGDDHGKWDLALVGRNLTNQITVDFASAWPAPLTNNPHAFQEVDEPRVFEIEGRYHF
jgi:iron complex outermembrane receptor protein